MSSYDRWRPLRRVGDHVALNDDYSNSVAFVCIARPDGTTFPIGTGFFVGMPRENGGYFRYLVTARHVAECGRPTFMRVAKFDGSGVREEPIPEWRSHERSDVAAAAVDIDLSDCIAQYTPEQHFTDKWPHRDSRILRGNTVYFIGLLTSVPTMVDRVVPMVRAGTIGAMWVEDVPVVDGKHKRIEPIVHLIDGYSRSGHSGAPCILEQLYIGKKDTGLAVGSFVGLLGVVVGHFDAKVPVALQGDPNWDTGYEVPANSGIATVVPIEVVRELLENDERLVTMRDEGNASDRERGDVERFAEAATTDTVPIDEFGEFENLARKIVAVPKSEIDEQREAVGKKPKP